MVYPEALAQRSQADCEALAILLRRLVVGKLNHPRINPLASFGYVYVILRHVADRPAMAVNTPPCGPSCYGGQHPTGLTGSCGRIRIRVAAAQSWPVRRPPGFIEPCRKTHRRASYWLAVLAAVGRDCPSAAIKRAPELIASAWGGEHGRDRLWPTKHSRIPKTLDRYRPKYPVARTGLDLGKHTGT